MISLISVFGQFIPSAKAIDFTKYCAPLGVCGNGEAFFIIFAERAAMMILSLIGGVCVLVVMYGGLRLTASAGNDSARDEAKKAIFTALIGLVFAVMGAAIVQFVANFIGSNFY